MVHGIHVNKQYVKTYSERLFDKYEVDSHVLSFVGSLTAPTP